MCDAVKICFKCGESKTLDSFYKHKRMGDGHLGKCKECTKKDVCERENILKKDPDWVESERKRGRNKYHRLGYKDKQKQSKEYKRKMMKNYRSKFPEKYKANTICQRMHMEGFEKHHWSYNKCDAKNIIWYTKKDHMKVHRFIRYNQEHFKYETLDGVLLETKEMFEEYANHKLKTEED